MDNHRFLYNPFLLEGLKDAAGKGVMLIAMKFELVALALTILKGCKSSYPSSGTESPRSDVRV